MFTGIVKAVGRVAGVKPRGGDVRLEIDVGDLHKRPVELGESVAVNGVCLTVSEADDSVWGFDVSNESLGRTVLCDLKAGEGVNLERALLTNEALGGHLVSGHVDGVGCLTSLQADARSTRMVFSAPGNLAKFIAEKGSICIDGVSLTINCVRDSGAGCEFEINIVPHTLISTTFGGMKPGRKVHLEIDQIARYLDRLMQFK